ncbi:MAG: hypothetical protein IJR59_02150 [Firmicutes bacterium]|nr:hypothetical protein [Bacillota bacterium]
MNEMNKSIDDMLLSIESNRQTIDEMLSTAKENNSVIKSKLQQYAETHSCLNMEQMAAYADYARAYDSVKQLYGSTINISSAEKISHLHNTDLAYNLLDEMHTKQLNFMEQICSVLEKACTAIKMLRRDTAAVPCY